MNQCCIVDSCFDSASCRAVVLVIDSVNFTTEYRDVAALLYDLLASWHHKQTPLLIACNKQGINNYWRNNHLLCIKLNLIDLLLAKNCDAIKSELEAEMYAFTVA